MDKNFRVRFRYILLSYVSDSETSFELTASYCNLMGN